MAERKKVDKKPVPKIEVKKKVSPKPVPKIEPKKRTTKEKPKPVVIKEEPKVLEPVIQEAKPKRKSADDDKYVRIAMNADPEKKKEFGEKVQRGELKFAYYAIDNEMGYHYYIVIKK
jgi:hypothetical protein